MGQLVHMSYHVGVDRNLFPAYAVSHHITCVPYTTHT